MDHLHRLKPGFPAHQAVDAGAILRDGFPVLVQIGPLCPEALPGNPDAGDNAGDDLGPLLAQQRQIPEIGRPPEHRHHPAVLPGADGFQHRRQVLVYPLGKAEAQRSPALRLQALKGRGLLEGQNGGIAPLVSQHQLSRPGDRRRVRRVRRQGRQAGGGQAVQCLRGQHGFVAVHLGGVQPRLRGGDAPDGSLGLGPEVQKLRPQLLELEGRVLAARVAVVPLEHQGPELQDDALRVIEPVRRQEAAVFQQVLGNLGVQLPGGLRRQGQVLGVLELLHPAFQAVDLRLAVQGGLVRVDRGHGSPGGHTFSLRPLNPEEAAALVRQHPLLPDHVARHVHGLLHLIAVGQDYPQGVVQVLKRLNAEVARHSQEEGGHQ